MTAAESNPVRFRFAPSHRVRRRADFDAIFKAGRRFTIGPLTVHGRPNGLPHCRLGLAVSRRFGNAVQRNAFKRRMREAFRLLQHELPRGYDLVATARPHAIEKMDVYQRMLLEAATRIDHQCQRPERTS